MRRSALLFDEDDYPTRLFADFLRDVQVPGNTLADIDSALQARFFQKNPDGTPKERWELNEVLVFCPHGRLKRHLQLCGFWEKTILQQWQYDRAAWPGALAVRAGARLIDLVDAWESGIRWSETIVFGGKRELQPKKESFQHVCEAFQVLFPDSAYPSWTAANPQTELEMMRWGWENIPRIPAELKSTPIVFVDAPMRLSDQEGGKPIRPSTEDTIGHWLNTRKSEPGSMLVSSGAPYGMAQDEAFWMLLGPFGQRIETFGHAAPDLPIEVFMREVAGCVNRIRRARGR